MKSIDYFDKIFIHRGPVDMRKSINGLSVIVDQDMEKTCRAEVYLFLRIEDELI